MGRVQMMVGGNTSFLVIAEGSVAMNYFIHLPEAKFQIRIGAACFCYARIYSIQTPPSLIHPFEQASWVNPEQTDPSFKSGSGFKG
jgi:hypothetical protein